jgi:hypothetical protein
MRIWVRTRAGSQLWWDDFTITIALASVIVLYAMNTRILSITKGHHTYYIPLPVIEESAKFSFVIFSVWVWSVCTIKISVCFMLLRIKQTNRWKFGLWTLMAALFTTASVATICYMIMCNPLVANWQLKYASDTEACWSVQTFLNFTYILSGKVTSYLTLIKTDLGLAFLFLTDVICALLPIAFIRKINRPLQEKVLLASLMGLGWFAFVCGLLKVVFLKSVLNSPDPIYASSPANMWGKFNRLYLLNTII